MFTAWGLAQLRDIFRLFSKSETLHIFPELSCQVNDWGWKMTVTPVMAKMDALNLPPAMLDSKLASLLRICRDGPKEQVQSAAPFKGPRDKGKRYIKDLKFLRTVFSDLTEPRALQWTQHSTRDPRSLEMLEYTVSRW